MDKALKLSWVVIASCLLLGAQMGVHSAILGTQPATGGVVGLLAAWPMNAGSGSTMVDLAASNPNNLTLQDAPPTSGTWGAVGGWPATPFTFVAGNGANQVPVGTPPNWLTNGSSPRSWCSWQKVTSFASQQSIWGSFLGPFYPTGVQFGMKASTGAIFLVLRHTVTTDDLEVDQSTSNSTGTNFQACATYDGTKTAAGINLYINGSAVSKTTVVNTLTGSSDGGFQVSVGALYNGSSSIQGLGGTLGYVSVWSCALTAGVIATNNAAGPSFTGLTC